MAGIATLIRWRKILSPDQHVRADRSHNTVPVILTKMSFGSVACRAWGGLFQMIMTLFADTSLQFGQCPRDPAGSLHMKLNVLYLLTLGLSTAPSLIYFSLV